MKKLILCLSVIIITFTSCEKEELTVDGNVVDKEINKNFNSFSESTIGTFENGTIRIGVSNEKIMTVFKTFVSKNKLDLKPESFNILSVDNKSYLRFYSKKNQVSTIEIFNNGHNRATLGKTVCSSTACASGGGCVPDGQYCTECTNNVDDCSRTTTGD